MRIFRPRSRRGRLAFAATALVAGCSTIGPPAMRSPVTPWDVAGTAYSVLMLRVVPGDPASPPTGARYLLAEAEAWAPDSSSVDGMLLRRPGNVPSEAAEAAGWLAVALAPGRQFLRLRASASGPVQDFMIEVPAGRSAVFAGSFRRDCGGDEATCRLLPLDGEEQAARDAVPEAYRAAFPLVVAPARPYPPRLAGTGLPPPTAPAIRADTTAWLSAVDWLGLLGEGVEIPEAPAGAFSSGGMQGVGDVMALGVLIVVLIPIALIALIVQSERERREGIASRAAEQRAEALRARAEAARAAWSPCEATIGAALAPETVVQRLETAMPRPRAARQGASSPWQLDVTRVVLRHCGAESGSFGVEIGTRWHAPGYDASFVRPVQGATPDNRLRWSDPAPWEVPVAPSGACRPLAEWCSAGGRLLLEEVVQGVTGARDAIAATR